jgi:hypothetical protein
LHSYLTRILLGDSLAADYLICHLISKIYLRRDVLCLGKFSLNLFQVTTGLIAVFWNNFFKTQIPI